MDKFEQKLRKYNLEELLFLISELTKEMFKNKVFSEKIKWEKSHKYYKEEGDFFISIWDLTDLVYFAIKNSNDL
jgi:hypothetical protein